MQKERSRLLVWIIIGGGAVIFFIVSLFAVILYSIRDEGRDELSFSSSKIGLIELNGVILESRSIVDQIQKFGDNSSIKAIIIRMDSPGGGVAASQEIYNEVQRVREKKKKVVVASMASVAASGAYYIACAADKIIANPGTITGSIGVIAEWYNYGELLRWAKLKNVVLKSGELKDAPSPVRELTAEESKYLQSIIDDMYLQFVGAVVDGRNLDWESAKALADGRVFTGKDAKEKNLIDEIGGLHDAIELTSRLANISGEPKLVTPTKRKRTLLDLLMEDVSEFLPFSSQLMDSRIHFSYLWK